MSTAADPGDHGSLGEEAVRLVQALGAWSHEHVDDTGEAGDAVPPPECTWCPVCRGLRALGVTNPEVREHLSAAGASLLAAVAAALAPPADMTAPQRAGHADRAGQSDRAGQADQEDGR